MKAIHGAIVMVVVCAGLASGQSETQSPEACGQAIAETMLSRDKGFGDFSATINVVQFSDSGTEHEVEIEFQALEADDGLRKRLVKLVRPPILKGTIVLTAENKGKPADRWVYLPAAKRVKRLAPGSDDGLLAKSEFSLADLRGKHPDDFAHRCIREETLDGVLCWVVERAPREAGSGLKRTLAWVGKETYHVYKVDIFDDAGELEKTLKVEDYQQYLGKFWRPQQVLVENHVNGKRATMTLSDVAFQKGLRKSDFTPNSLKRIR